ncbi:uncharacterized protein LOC127879191 [Dreissena polymorpha]|uniref:CS domain-containing protein n=1 Tax=Dreissena polymorpha TaxID=45954 RepID=A0A9D4H945_DREPO|nr:uncharacterized protein LOC127879191 [Dreissena polymorpha]KAH3831939.1 hypothetical protein DPMN_105212 [Dreissena polymorpha]
MAETETESHEKIDYITPAYACDEKTKEGYVRVIVAIKNLAISRDIVRHGLRPKMVKKASNAKVEVVFENQALCVTVNGEKDAMKGKNFQLKVRKLPHEIDSDKSYYKADEDRLLLFLCKLQNKSWYPELDNGLDLEDEED